MEVLPPAARLLPAPPFSSLSAGAAPGRGEGPVARPPCPAPRRSAARPQPSEGGRPQAPLAWAGQLGGWGSAGSSPAPDAAGRRAPSAERRAPREGRRGPGRSPGSTSTWRPPEDRALAEQCGNSSSNGVGGRAAADGSAPAQPAGTTAPRILRAATLLFRRLCAWVFELASLTVRGPKKFFQVERPRLCVKH